MTVTEFPAIGETLYRTVLKNGLTVLTVRKPGFSKKIAYYTANCGGIHTEFTLDGKQYRVPAGTAHFLEHKQFDMPGGRDVTAELSALGAYPNAFTGFDTTAYYFSCTENFNACLELLLSFVSTPFYTKETVEKELGIIGQEIDMNLDSPESRCYDALTEAMYAVHPIRQPILGTRETIAEITPEILTLCHRAYYHPKNCVLAVIGDVDPEAVVAIAEKVLPEDWGEAPILPEAWTEPMTCPVHETRMTMDVPKAIFHLAFKCEDVPEGEAAMRQDFIGDLAAEILCGESSPLYGQLYAEGLIDTAFACGFDAVTGAAQLIFSGESDTPEEVRSRILGYGQTLLKEGIEDAAFRRLVRSFLGQRLQGLDSFDGTCYRLCCGHFINFDFFRFPEVLSSILPEEVLSFIARVVQADRCTLSIVEPEE